jgi:hypothetical protein
MNRNQINSNAIAASILSSEDLAIIEFVENDDSHDYWFEEMEEKAFYAAEYESFCSYLDSLLPAYGDVIIRSQVG